MSSSEEIIRGRPRIESVDLVRGLIMVIMALDHTRDFFHQDAFLFNPTDVSRTTPILFFTRWITHLCAPAFMLLAGISIRLQRAKKTRKELAVFLLTRGAWLVFLEFTVVRFGFQFNFYYDMTILTVFWVIGGAMILMAGVLYLSDRVALLLGLFIVITHSLPAQLYTPEGTIKALWTMLMNFGVVTLTPDHLLIIAYPMLPWAAIVMIGYSAGRLYEDSVPGPTRVSMLWKFATLSIGAFAILRCINLYDDPWTSQADTAHSILSFMNVTKRPPSLQFTLLMLGPIFIFLALAEQWKGKAASFFLTFGRVPTFYFIVHFYIIHLAALTLYMIRSGKNAADIDFHFSKSFGGIPPGAGVSLAWVYVAWIAVIILLFPLCRWYSNYKQRHRAWWLSYL